MSDTIKQKVERANALMLEARQLITEQKEADWQQKAEGKIKEAEALKADAVKANDLLQRAVDLDMPQPGEGKDRKEPENAKFRDFGEFLYEAWIAENPRYKGRKRHAGLKYFNDEPAPGHEKTLTENVGAAGGFLVPQDFRAELLSVMGESSIVRPRATIIRMARRQIAIPVVDQTGTTAGQAHWFGGMVGYWAEEAAEKTASDASFRQVVLTAHKLIGYTRASDELVDDAAISLGDFLSGPMGFAGLLAWMEDYAFLNGTGVGQPLGVIKAGATITVNRQATSPAVQFDDLANMRAQCLPSGNYVWVVNQGLMDEFITMNGPSGNASYIWQQNAVDGIPTTIMGFPVIWSEKNPAPDSAGDVVLADFNYYLVGDRQATTIESTQYDYWRYDQTSWRAVHRVDGQPWLSAPLTLQDGTTQISPFIVLGAKST